jgi:hypothetical protein
MRALTMREYDSLNTSGTSYVRARSYAVRLCRQTFSSLSAECTGSRSTQEHVAKVLCVHRDPQRRSSCSLQETVRDLLHARVPQLLPSGRLGRYGTVTNRVPDTTVTIATKARSTGAVNGQTP